MGRQAPGDERDRKSKSIGGRFCRDRQNLQGKIRQHAPLTADARPLRGGSGTVDSSGCTQEITRVEFVASQPLQQTHPSSGLLVTHMSALRTIANEGQTRGAASGSNPALPPPPPRGYAYHNRIAVSIANLWRHANLWRVWCQSGKSRASRT